jgi:hypothetical protein
MIDLAACSFCNIIPENALPVSQGKGFGGMGGQP